MFNQWSQIDSEMWCEYLYFKRSLLFYRFNVIYDKQLDENHFVWSYP